MGFVLVSSGGQEPHLTDDSLAMRRPTFRWSEWRRAAPVRKFGRLVSRPLCEDCLETEMEDDHTRPPEGR
jgi:hypothetical protein